MKNIEFTREEAVALHLLSQGVKPYYSTGICEEYTCGFGELDYYGYWQFPLYELAEKAKRDYQQYLKRKSNENPN